MRQACLLAIIAGYADTVGYLEFEAFAGLMTGNTIFLGLDIAQGHWRLAIYHCAIILSFLAGVVAARLLVRLGWHVWWVLSLTAALLVLTGFLGKTSGALLLPFAMGLQNSAANRFNGVALNTVFITGNLQKLGEGFAHWLFARKTGEVSEASDGMAIYGFVWLGYAGGAVLGGLANAWLTLPLLLPALVLPFVMMSDETNSMLRMKMRHGFGDAIYWLRQRLNVLRR